MTRSIKPFLILSSLTGLLIFCLGSVSLAQEYVEGEVIVRLKGSQKDKDKMAFVGRNSMSNKIALKKSWSGMKMFHYKAKNGQTTKELLNELRQDPDVEYAEPNYIVNKASVGNAGAKYTLDEMQELVSNQKLGSTSADIQAQEVWGSLSSLSGPKPIVAVIDTGLDTVHPVFTGSGALWNNPGEVPNNGIDDDGNGYVDDVNGWNFVNSTGDVTDDDFDGHGTHVAGIVLGVGLDIFASPIATSQIEIMPLKFLDGDGVGKTSDAIEAIYYAVNNGATVLNNSWGGTGYSASLQEAIAYAYELGVVFVAASGNTNNNNDFTPIYPASFTVPNIMSIAATTDADELAYFSNYGPSGVHLGSPGVFIRSTVPNGFNELTGTSMAAPFVSGLAILMKIEAPTMLSYQIKTIIFSEGDVKSQLDGFVSTKARVNVLNAVSLSKVATIETTQPPYNFTTADRDLASALSGGGCGLVSKLAQNSKFGGGSGGGNGGGPNTWYIFLVVGLLLLPLALIQYLRSRSPKSRRQHKRFILNSNVSLKCGDDNLVGSISTISTGGVHLNVNKLLEEGGVVKMTISSPDGTEAPIEVEGCVVWRQGGESYGVRFQDAQESVLKKVSSWTKNLIKAS